IALCFGAAVVGGAGAVVGGSVVGGSVVEVLVVVVGSAAATRSSGRAAFSTEPHAGRATAARQARAAAALRTVTRSSGEVCARRAASRRPQQLRRLRPLGTTRRDRPRGRRRTRGRARR